MNRKIVALSIPTGINAQTGGFAGDGGKIARMFSKYFDVIVNPNVVNGGILSGVNEHILYTEGSLFDEFLGGRINLRKLNEFEENKIGVIFDKQIPEKILNVHINTIYALREVMGLNIPYFEITNENVGIDFFVKNNISNGTIKNEKTLLDAAYSLIAKGVNAIAVVCYFKDDITTQEYENGNGVDPIGGIEAVISHFLSQELKIQTAHAPAFSTIDILYDISNSKTASENISSTYLPSVLIGLSKAPEILLNSKCEIKNKDIEALILPHTALGGKGALYAIENNIPIVTVKNKTNTKIGCKELKINGIIEYENYEKCLDGLLKRIDNEKV